LCEELHAIFLPELQIFCSLVYLVLIVSCGIHWCINSKVP